MKVFNEVVGFKRIGSLAVITLLFDGEKTAANGKTTLPWGTPLHEHRINPIAIDALNSALDYVLEEDFRALVVIGEGRFFCNGLDLKWVDAHPKEGVTLQANTERLLARILTFPLPTVAGVNGHMCAAGAMLGLSFDYRIMLDGNSWFFIPALDLGLVYSSGMTSLMKAKTAPHIHRDMICYAKRYRPRECLEEKIVDICTVTDSLEQVCYDFIEANLLKPKFFKDERFRGDQYRLTLQKIKMNTYYDTYHALMNEDIEDMGFSTGKWSTDGTVATGNGRPKL
uniref:Uncharacterized protein n=1 Tax=Aplanochytrium stocchinoi TaxID=215587 RepID=A0A7S3P9Z8_9STRA|mmetsp:Transcript_19073/g.24257  ORF Transcript_19073/g.24257 Transcript_19073/m.24257 type:complete len:283 (-) Transcript_19073:196-1044(-)|eukprot:CAMPEP_0204873760 /NCGR_PEP_ID=MMETSP1348-20121228/41509_1 /ASSEMBLY_ACC=CAM_ASM_000700 /TAXON_ID=215587 /ORGANISM="Aplanochytrium stocchinoi, Strain GSBS06" /LENGTH=282 /DNA_ID=CAMNT_0052029247 /DNA_START=81 /DNA_END=929 /DNA_ORIENTATION=+